MKFNDDDGKNDMICYSRSRKSLVFERLWNI